jgi:hypothetical protein
MRHFASPSFWQAYERLPPRIRGIADKNYLLLKQNPRHPSLHFKKIGAFHSIRVGLRHRALALEEGSDLIWFWIGSHAEYDEMLRR